MSQQNGRIDMDEDEQDVDAAVGVKSDYIRLLDKVATLDVNNQSVQQNVDNLDGVIKQSSQLLVGVKNTAELYLDAKILSTTTNCIEEAISNLDVGEGSFNLIAFAEMVRKRSLMDGEPSCEALAAVGEPVLFNYVPEWTPLIGCFEYSKEEKIPHERKQRKRDVIVAKKEPEKVTEIANKEKGSVEEIVQGIFRKLCKRYKENGCKPVNYFKFIIDPNSFSKSVENLFHVSFLSKDKYVVIDIQDGVPLIYPASTRKSTQDSEQSSENYHTIISIDMESWREAINILDIQEAMI